MPMQGSFDASQFAPKQGGEAHPVGKGFDATISNTTIEPTKDNTGGMFIVEFTTPVGSIVNRYNLWNSNAKAVEIAHGQLSALCHATGVFRLDWTNDGAALRNARCKIDVAYQKGQEPTADNPTGGYVEVKKVYDAAGNEPGKAPAAPQPQQQQQPAAPMQQNANGAWANAPQASAQQNWGNQQTATPPQNNAAPPANNPPWGGGAPQQQAPAGNGAPNAPPWARS